MLSSYLSNIEAIYNSIVNCEISKVSNLGDLLTKKTEIANGLYKFIQLKPLYALLARLDTLSSVKIQHCWTGKSKAVVYQILLYNPSVINLIPNVIKEIKVNTYIKTNAIPKSNYFTSLPPLNTTAAFSKWEPETEKTLLVQLETCSILRYDDLTSDNCYIQITKLLEDYNIYLGNNLQLAQTLSMHYSYLFKDNRNTTNASKQAMSQNSVSLEEKLITIEEGDCYSSGLNISNTLLDDTTNHTPPSNAVNNNYIFIKDVGLVKCADNILINDNNKEDIYKKYCNETLEREELENRLAVSEKRVEAYAAFVSSFLTFAKEANNNLLQEMDNNGNETIVFDGKKQVVKYEDYSKWKMKLGLPSIVATFISWFKINPLDLTSDSKNKLLNCIVSRIPFLRDNIATAKQRSAFWKNYKHRNITNKQKKKVKITKKGVKRNSDEAWLLSEREDDDHQSDGDN